MLPIKKISIALVVIVIIVGFLFAFIICKKNNPIEIIENKFNLKLPSSVKIINFDYEILTGEFDAKVQINKDDIEYLRIKLLDYFKYEEPLEYKDYISNFGNTTSWWDMNKKGVVSYYSKCVSDKDEHNTKELWAFIAKQEDGLYYLYISNSY